MQPPSQDPTNQPGSSFYQNYGQERHPGEEGHYGTAPQPPSEDYAARYHSHSEDKLRQPKKRNPLTFVVLVLAALVIILGATTVLVLRHTNPPPVTATPAATQQASNGQATPVPTAPSSANGAATSTPTLSSAATVPSGTITENLLLTCGANCNDPIRVTITTIQVNDAAGNMTWNISLQNVSGSSMGYGINTFELLPSGTQNQIPVSFAQNSGTLANSDPQTIQGTFSFVPTQNTAYTLTVVIEENPYMGPGINFDPAQITNL